MRHQLSTLALCVTLAAPTHASTLTRATSALPDVGAPPEGTAQWVARSMRMNGLPITMRVFESRLAPAAVLSHYESQMKTQRTYEVRRWTNAAWQVLALLSREHFITIHARAVSHGSEGTILVSPTIEPASLRKRTKFPRPSGTRVLNLQEYDDDGVQSEHISLSSDRASFTELQAFSQLLIGEGWSVVDTKPTYDVHHGYVLEVQRQAEHALLVFVPNVAQPATTAIAITWRK